MLSNYMSTFKWTNMKLTVKEEEIRHQKEVEKARQARMKKETEEKEYEQYLKLKKKFEKE